MTEKEERRPQPSRGGARALPMWTEGALPMGALAEGDSGEAITGLAEEGLLLFLTHTPDPRSKAARWFPTGKQQTECCLKRPRSIARERRVRVSSLSNKWVDQLEPPPFSPSHTLIPTQENATNHFPPSRGCCTRNSLLSSCLLIFQNDVIFIAYWMCAK